jgi:hypothetical protein
MPPKLKPATLPPKKATKKESGVEKLTSSVSRKLNINVPLFKPYSMKTLDGYMTKPYTKKSLILLKLIFTLQACYRSMDTRWN